MKCSRQQTESKGWRSSDQEEIHLAIVDVMMPRMDGITHGYGDAEGL